MFLFVCFELLSVLSSAHLETKQNIDLYHIVIYVSTWCLIYSALSFTQALRGWRCNINNGSTWPRSEMFRPDICAIQTAVWLMNTAVCFLVSWDLLRSWNSVNFRIICPSSDNSLCVLVGVDLIFAAFGYTE